MESRSWTELGVNELRHSEGGRYIQESVGMQFVGNIVVVMEVPGRRRRGRPKLKWLDNNKNDL